MKFVVFFSLITFLSVNLISKIPYAKKDVPKYVYSNFDAKEYDLHDIDRYIELNGLPKIYFPYRTNEEANAPLKEKRGPILTKSGIPLVQITNDNFAQNETWIAVNPTNPLNAIATCNDASTNGIGRQYRMPSYVTKDGGKTWNKYTTQNHNSQYILQVPQGAGATIFDPAIVFNKDGKAIYGYGFATDYRNDGDNGIFVSVSDDGGVTWNQTTDYDDLYMVTYSPTGNGLQDRYTMAVDLFSENYEGNVYIAWRDFSINQSIRVGASTKEDYKLWNDRTVFSASPATQAPVPIVDYKGQVWVSFRFSSATEKTSAPIYISTDGGNSYKSHSTAMEVWNIGTPRDGLPAYARVSLPNKDSMRMSTNPQLAIDNSNGPNRGNVYCIMPGKDGGLNGPTRIYLGILKNGVEDPNAKWETIRIDDNPYGNDMFFPSITVDPVTGYIHIFYYSSQFDPNNEYIDAMYAYSYDGVNFKHKRLTDESSLVRAVGQADEGNRYWGDYARIEAYNNRVYPLFWLSDASVQFAYFKSELYTSLITTAPVGPEVVDLNYNGTNNSVEISWSGIYDGLGEPIDDYIIKLYKDGNLIGEFNKNTFNYIDTEVENGVEYTYGFQVISSDVRGEGEIYDYKIFVGGSLTLMPPTNFKAHSHPDGILFEWNTPNMTDGGVQINDISGIKIYMNDEEIVTVPQKSIQAGETNTYLWETETEKFYMNFYATALRTRNGETGESESSNLVNLAYSGAPFTDFKEDFESEETMIPVYKTGKWGVTNEKASSGEYSLTESPNEDYSSTEDSYIILPPFIVTNEKPNLVFEMIALVRDKDYVMFESTKDNGKTWQFGNKYSISWGQNLWDSQNYSIENSEWLLSSLDFIDEGYKDGDTVMVKISFKATPITRAPGVFIDNMRMDAISNVINEISSYSNLYPNPAKDNFRVDYQLEKSSNITLQVLDIFGNELISIDKGFLRNGEYYENIDVSNIISGSYFLRISTGKNQQIIPFVINK